MKSPLLLFTIVAFFLSLVSANAENYIYRGSKRYIHWDTGTSLLQGGYLIVGDFVKVSDTVSTATMWWIETGGVLGLRKFSYVLPIDVRYIRAEENRGAAFSHHQTVSNPGEQRTVVMVLHGVTSGTLKVPAHLAGSYQSTSDEPGYIGPTVSRTTESWHLERTLTAASNLADESVDKAVDRVWEYLTARGFTADL